MEEKYDFKKISRNTAISLISQLYNVNISILDSESSILPFCQKYQFHSVQQYFDPMVLNTIRDQLKDTTIYYVTDALMVNFVIFSIENTPFLIGPFCSIVLSSHDASTLLQANNLHDIDTKTLLTYTQSLPFIKENDMQKIVFSFIDSIHSKEPNKIIQKLYHQNDILPFSEGNISEELFADVQIINQRYAHEQRFMQNITMGNIRASIKYLHIMKQDVSYLKTLGTTMENERIGAAITRTTVRLAATRAGLPALLIDQISSQNTKETLKARTAEEISLSQEKMIQSFCHEIQKIKKNDNSVLVQSILYQLEHNYAETINFKELAASLNVSHTYMITVFKKEIGVTPNQYLSKFRMEQASVLLINRNMSIEKISFAVGISDANYFVKLFKKYYGVTPSEFRK